MNGSWKRLERLVASWLKTCRNPLSGRNNVGDDGQRRLGDIILTCGVVEVKRRQDLSFKRALETRRLAAQSNKPWAHYEFKTGQGDMVAITVDFETAKYLSDKLRERWSAQAHLSREEVPS